MAKKVVRLVEAIENGIALPAVSEQLARRQTKLWEIEDKLAALAHMPDLNLAVIPTCGYVDNSRISQAFSLRTRNERRASCSTSTSDSPFRLFGTKGGRFCRSKARATWTRSAAPGTSQERLGQTPKSPWPILLLLGTTLTFYQHNEIRPRHAPDLVTEPVDVSASPDELLRLQLVSIRQLDRRWRWCVGPRVQYQRDDADDVTQDLARPRIQVLWLGPHFQDHRRIRRTTQGMVRTPGLSRTAMA